MSSSYLRYPLLFILGNKSQLAILRYLCLNKDSIASSGELLQAVSLSKQSVFNAIDTLEQLGILIKTGKKGTFHYSLRINHPLANDLITLFENEKNFSLQLLNQLRELFIPFPIDSVYISGKYALNTDTYGDLLELEVISDSTLQSKIKPVIQDSIRSSNMEKHFDITIKLSFFSKEEYLETQKKGVLVYGFDINQLETKEFLNNSTAISHKNHEEKSLKFMNKVIGKLQSNPSLINKTIVLVEEKLISSEKSIQKTYSIWLDMLKNWPLIRIQTFFETESDLRTQLLQSNPFWLNEDLVKLIEKQ